MSVSISKMSVMLTGTHAPFVRSMSEAGNGVDGFAARVARSSSVLTGMVGGLGAAAVAAGVAGAAMHTLGKASQFEDALADARAAANLSAEQYDRLAASSLSASKTLGLKPTGLVQGATELLKAGMDIDRVLGGAAESVAQFAKVGRMEAGEAAVTLNDASNVFAKDGMSTARTADTISRAADGASISIRDVAMALSMSGAVAGGANQTLADTTAAIGVLGNNGVKGSDAGTSLKTFLLRLQTGAESAGETMDRLGINVRDASGAMKPMREIVAELEAKLGGLTGKARDQALLKLFGTDAIRAGQILLKAGVKGWDDYQRSLGGAMTVAEKYATLQDTVTGAMDAASSAADRLSIVVGGRLAKAFDATESIKSMSEAVETFADVGLGRLESQWGAAGFAGETAGMKMVNALEGAAQSAAWLADHLENLGYLNNQLNAAVSPVFEAIGRPFSEDFADALAADAAKSRAYLAQDFSGHSNAQATKIFFDEVRRKMEASQKAAAAVAGPKADGGGWNIDWDAKHAPASGDFDSSGWQDAAVQQIQQAATETDWFMGKLADGVVGWAEKLANDARSRLGGEAARIFEQTRTPLEKFQAEMEKVQQLAALGLIDADTLARAEANAASDFAGMRGPREVEALERRFASAFDDGRGTDKRQEQALALAREQVKRLASIEKNTRAEPEKVVSIPR